MTIDVVCNTCGEELEEQSPRHGNRGAVRFTSCETCCANAHRVGYEEGHRAGYNEGLADGEQAVRDDVKSMLQIVKEESCGALTDGATSPVSS